MVVFLLSHGKTFPNEGRDNDASFSLDCCGIFAQFEVVIDLNYLFKIGRFRFQPRFHALKQSPLFPLIE